MNPSKVIGVDFGATNIRGAVVSRNIVSGIKTQRTNNRGTEEEVLKSVFQLIDSLIDEEVTAIGIGVPSVVDVQQGVVLDVQFIPSWKEIPLKKIIEERYNISAFVNNDANCFALGEYYFGRGKGYESMIGLTIGTGMGAGIILDKKLYAGYNCGAGEFGTVDYLDKTYEYYCSGSFFENVHQLSGEMVFQRAKENDQQALKLFEEMGMHLGNAIKMIMYTYDPPLIVLGGSVRFAYEYFVEAMWQRIKTCVYLKSVERLRIEISQLENSGILGAAALCYNAVPLPM